MRLFLVFQPGVRRCSLLDGFKSVPNQTSTSRHKGPVHDSRNGIHPQVCLACSGAAEFEFRLQNIGYFAYSQAGTGHHLLVMLPSGDCKIAAVLHAMAAIWPAYILKYVTDPNFHIFPPVVAFISERGAANICAANIPPECQLC